MSNWAEDPQLYLYTKGVDVYLWRCNEAKDSMLMKMEDFDDLGKVTNHLDLVGLGNTSIINWDRDNYISLVKYISSLRLLVNSHGLVIAELSKYTEDGKMDDNQSPVYIRALDVLPLERFNLRERPIPLRTARYLEGDGTRDAPVVEVTNVQQGLSNVVKRLLVTDLECIVKKFAQQTNETEILQQEWNLLNSITDVLVSKVTELVMVDTGLYWMNGFTDSNWVGIEEVPDLTHLHYTVTIDGPQGTYTVDENSSNVRASYFYRVELGNYGAFYKAVAIQELNLGKLKARFDNRWWLINYKGITYVVRNEFE